MHATALMTFDNSTFANFQAWAWGQGTWPSPTQYGISTFLTAGGFTQTGTANATSAINVTSAVTTGNAATGASSFTTPTFNTATNDLMVVFIRWFRNSAQNISTVSDLGGNTWTLINTWNNGTPNTYVAAYYVQGATAFTNNSVTVTMSASTTYVAIAAYDANNVATSGALEVYASNFSSTATTSLTTTITTTNANDIIFAFNDIDSAGATLTFPAGWSPTGMFPIVSGGNFCNAAYQTFTSTQSSLGVTVTSTANATCIGVLIAFKQANVVGSFIGDGQVVWSNTTATITSTQSSGTTATYGFSTLAGGPLREGQYIAAVSGTTNGGGTFNITIPSQLVVIKSVSYSSSTSGTFTTQWSGGTFSLQAESGSLTISGTSFWLTGTNLLPSNNSTIGNTVNAGYQTNFRGYWLAGTTYSQGDVVIYITNGLTGASAQVNTFVSLTNSNTGNTPPVTNANNTNWGIYNYEVWETTDSALPTFVQGNTQSQSVTFNPLGYSSPNVVGNTLIVYGRFTGGSGTPTISDTNNNTWLTLFNVTNGSDINIAWVAFNIKAGANYVHVTQATQNSLQLIIAEYSGVSSISTAVDQTATATGSSTAPNSGNVTTVQATELILGFVSNSTTNGLTITPGSGFTSRETVNGNTYLEDKVVGATGTYSASATLSSSVPWFCAVVTLKGTTLSPFYFKLEYGNNGTNAPMLYFQIGTLTTGYGALSTAGNRGYREYVGYTGGAANASNTYETDFYADTTPGLAGGKFAMIGWRTATNNQQWFLGWERSKDNFGVDTSLYMTYVIGVNPTNGWRQSSVFASGGLNFGLRTTESLITISMSNNVSMATGNYTAVSPVWPNVGYFGNPLTILLGMAEQDVNEGGVFIASVYNANHNYLMTAGVWTRYLANVGNQFSGLALRWD